MTKASTTPKAEKATPAAVKARKAPATKAVERSAADRRADASMQFAVQQLSTPVAVPQAPQTPPAAINTFAAELAALQAKHGVVAKAVKVTAPKADKVQQNGITRPAAHTLCGVIWKAADDISAAIHGVCSIAALREHEEVKVVNSHTVKTQYARWRAYNGVHGRLPTIQATATQGAYDGMKPH